ncbi:MAG: type II toxin-antitoxin system RelE/ParE family toxin [Rubrivivax sp.]
MPGWPSSSKARTSSLLNATADLVTAGAAGRAAEAFPEWVIDFGDSGYVARYRIDADLVTVLAVRHQKESGFS